MSKKLLTLFVFGLLPVQVYCMEGNDPYGNSGTSSMVPSSSSSSSSSAIYSSSSTAPSSAVLFPTDTSSSVPSLLALSASASVKKLTSPEGIKQFLANPRWLQIIKDSMPDEMSNLVAKQIIQQHGIPLPVLKAFLPVKPLAKLQINQNGMVYRLVLDSKEKLAAETDYDGSKISIYDVHDPHNPQLIETLFHKRFIVASRIFNQEGIFVENEPEDVTHWTLSSDIIRLFGNYDINDFGFHSLLIKKIGDYIGDFYSLSFNPQGTLLAVGGGRGRAFLYDMNTHHEAMDFIKNKLTINQALFLFACGKNKLYLSGHPHLIETFEQFPKNFQKALVDAGLVVLPSSWMASGIVGGIAAAVAGYVFYSYLKK